MPVRGSLLCGVGVAVAVGFLAVACDAGTAGVPSGPAGRVAAPQRGVFPSGAVELSYALRRPRGSGPWPAVVIGHGSGQVRKEDCRRFAGQLERRGFATLCYDKRGVGESTGEYSGVGTSNGAQTIRDLAGDMAAGVRFLRAQPRIDAGRIGLAGPSQAGWIMPVAAEHAPVAFMILVVGPTVSIGEEIYYSQFAEQTATPLDQVYEQYRGYTGPDGFDPYPVLARLDVPALWLLGAEDRSIPTRDTVAILDELIGLGKPYRHIVYPGVGHSLRGVDIWPDVAEWLAEVAGNHAAAGTALAPF